MYKTHMIIYFEIINPKDKRMLFNHVNEWIINDQSISSDYKNKFSSKILDEGAFVEGYYSWRCKFRPVVGVPFPTTKSET